MQPRCDTCACYQEHQTSGRGICRLNPPQMTVHLLPGPANLAGQQSVQPIPFVAWPQVGATDWCYQHKSEIALS